MSDALRILTIDDDPAVRRNIIAFLEDSGFLMLEADSGRAGLDMIRSECPDLVLCDLRMPEMDGLEVIEIVGSEFPGLPIIVVSGTGVMQDAIEALRRGAWDYVIKPISDMAVLEHTVGKALERARLIRQNEEHQRHLETVNRELQESLRKLEEDAKAGRRVQFQFLPDKLKVLGGCEFSRYLLSSMYLSGDFVDYFMIDTDHVGFYIADVSGHGASSAIVTVMLKSFVNQYLDDFRYLGNRAILDPAHVLSKLNRDIAAQKLEKYFTMFFGVMDFRKGTLSYSNGGHFPRPILYDGLKASFLPGKGFPVGLFDDASFEEAQLALPERFVLTLFSDGVLETLPQEKLLGKHQFLLSMVDSVDVNVEFVLEALGLDHRSAVPDDVTLLLVKRS